MVKYAQLCDKCKAEKQKCLEKARSVRDKNDIFRQANNELWAEKKLKK